MIKFEAVKAITGIKEFSEIMFELSKKVESAEGLAEELSLEIPEEGLQTLKSIARSGNYPLSLELLQ